MSFAFQDSDLDGVEDSMDRCPNTPILALVDRYGCSVDEDLGRTFYFRTGIGFIKTERRSFTFSLISFAYSHKELYLSLTTKYYLNNSGLGESSIFLGYSNFPAERLYVLSGVNLRLPTGDYSDRKVYLTPSVAIDYLFSDYDVFTFISYTLGRNTPHLSLGGGYDISEKLYMSLSYDLSRSAVRDSWNRYLSLFALYNFNERVYTTLSYSRGLNRKAIDSSLIFKVGFRF